MLTYHVVESKIKFNWLAQEDSIYKKTCTF